MLQKDFEELKNMTIDFYTATGIMLAIYDRDFRLIYGHPNHSTLCKLIRKSPPLMEKCLQCDRNAMRKCKETKHSLIYECHIGLTEAMTPIILSDTIIGYLLIGQILPMHNILQVQNTIDSLPSTFGLTRDELNAALKEMKSISKEKLKATVHILDMCASFISLNRFVLSVQNPLKSEIENYIYKNISDPELSMISICDHFSISRSALYKLSKEAYGIGISDYIRYCRIEKAKELLLLNDLSIVKISRLCGYTDPSFFTKSFKRLTGVLPKKYVSLLKYK